MGEDGHLICCTGQTGEAIVSFSSLQSNGIRGQTGGLQGKGFRQHTVPRGTKQKWKTCFGKCKWFKRASDSNASHSKSNKLCFPVSKKLPWGGWHQLISMATCTLGVRKGRKKEVAKKSSLLAARSGKVIDGEDIDLFLLNHLNRTAIGAALVWQECKLCTVEMNPPLDSTKGREGRGRGEEAPYRKHPLVPWEH